MTVSHDYEAGSSMRERLEQRGTHEGKVTRKVETITSAFPSGIWLALAGASVLGSLTFKILGRDQNAQFVGQWAPMFMLIGVYNKLVKIGGSDRAAGLNQA